MQCSSWFISMLNSRCVHFYLNTYIMYVPPSKKSTLFCDVVPWSFGPFLWFSIKFIPFYLTLKKFFAMVAQLPQGLFSSNGLYNWMEIVHLEDWFDGKSFWAVVLITVQNHSYSCHGCNLTNLKVCNLVYVKSTETYIGKNIDIIHRDETSSSAVICSYDLYYLS